MPEDTNNSYTYSKLVEFIEESESEERGAQRSPASIDLETALNAALSRKGENYEEMIASISEADVQKRPKEEKPKEQKEVKPHIITSGVEQARYSAPIPSPLVREEEAAKKELEAIKEKLKEIKPAIKELRMKRVNTKDLILPSLSISDQIAELERIIEGVRGCIFDDEHLGIVKQEVYGLNSVVERDERLKRKSGEKSASSIEESLLAVRQQRLQDAMGLLRNR